VADGGEVRFRRVGYDSEVAQTLVGEMAADLSRYYGPQQFADQDPGLWRAPEGALLIAYCESSVAACGAIVRFDRTTAEVKRMFTRPGFRRRGIADRMLAALEDEARALGYQRLVLETGRPQLEAQRLYSRNGFEQMQCWSPHDADPVSVCFSRAVSPVSD
jgi:GNAT superfamily N-acetyltransferase